MFFSKMPQMVMAPRIQRGGQVREGPGIARRRLVFRVETRPVVQILNYVASIAHGVVVLRDGGFQCLDAQPQRFVLLCPRSENKHSQKHQSME